MRGHRVTTLFLALFLLLDPGSPVVAGEQVARDEVSGVVIDEVRPPVTIDGARQGNTLTLTVKLQEKERCFGQLYLEDPEQHVLMPAKLAPVKKAPFGFGLGFGIGGGRGAASQPCMPRERRKTGGGGVGVGLGISVFDLFKGKDCPREVEVQFVIPPGREQVAEWTLHLSVVNPDTKEERFAMYPIAETRGKVHPVE